MCTAGQRVSLTNTGPGPSFILVDLSHILYILEHLMYAEPKIRLMFVIESDLIESMY